MSPYDNPNALCTAYTLQACLLSYAVSADASHVFYMANKTQVIKWHVIDSDIAAEIDLSASLSALTEKGN